MKRTPIAQRPLPNYSRGEECMNMVTHIVGGGFAIIILIACLIRAALNADAVGAVCSAIYGGSMIALYTVSSVYHGLRTVTSKKVMQVIDHCTIYFLIAGTYTPIVLCAFRPVYPALGWGLFALEWGLLAAAVTLTAIDLQKYNIFSMICYIGMGWAVIPFWRQAMVVLGKAGFLLLLSGGIAYTIGAVLYGLGSRKKWMHSVFHIFVVIGSVLQFFAVLLYAL